MHQHVDNEMIMSLRDWRLAVRTPTTFRVGSSTFRIQTQFVTAVTIVGLILLCIIYIYATPHRYKSSYQHIEEHEPQISKKASKLGIALTSQVSPPRSNYNSTYPLTPPVTTKIGVKYKIGLVSDMDQLSKSKTEGFAWISYFLKGYIVWNRISNTVTALIDNTPVTLKSNLGESGRGMELSELVVFNGKLYTFDDRTGIIFEIDDENVIPWVMLTDGNGRTGKGFKSEWAAVKNEKLYVGGLGKEWTNHQGETINLNPLWVKSISPTGEVNHSFWRDNYFTLRSTIGIEFPGYVSHEAAVWSDVHSRWFFLPRRCSKDRYNPDLDEKRACNVLLSADEDFKDIKVTNVGEINPTHGFSSFRFIPGTSDKIIVALKSVEDSGVTETYIMAFDISGKILLEETKVGNVKYEGIEFI
ncbi:soluble calcium-activated nucleotidase 1 [Bacillus rossius redtenbacheri]|uniref:soluble calcium-activated nucleotidase 1 n=1 Tax=Bacillus rossius redtenbacheri TaxID=93214 RepID=UPI002FDD5CF3